MVEFWYFTKRPKFQIISTEEHSDKVIENIVNEVMKENFLNLVKEMPIQVNGAHQTP